MKKWSLFLLLVAVAAFAVQPAAAQDTKHKVYVGLAQIMPMGSDTISIPGIGDFDAEFTDTIGYGVGYEYRLTKLMGLDFDYMMATQDAELDGQKFGEIDFNPLSASLNFHLWSNKLVDFYVAPTISYVMWGDLKDTPLGTGSVDKEFAFGATVGVDIGNEKYAFTGGLRYLMVDATIEDEVDITADPLLIRAGFAFKF